MRYVVTGGPGIGKTTLLKELFELGHLVVPEAARYVIRTEEKKPDGVLPWRDMFGFQQLVARQQLALEAMVQGGPVFFDRGLLDNIAYCRIHGVNLPPELDVKPDYTRIFVPDRLPNYATDAERKEDQVLAERLHELIAAVYQEHGFELVRVPVLTPRERAEFVLSKVD